jgi:transposase
LVLIPAEPLNFFLHNSLAFLHGSFLTLRAVMVRPNSLDHSSLSIIRQRLEGPVFEEVFKLGLSALQQHGLLRGKNLGIDSSIMEANASLRGLVNRNTGEQYWEYVKRLLQESGIDPKDTAAVRKFDRKRPKK